MCEFNWNLKSFRALVVTKYGLFIAVLKLRTENENSVIKTKETKETKEDY